MRRLSSAAFDYDAERKYYAAPPAESLNFGYLDAYYRLFLDGYSQFFDNRRVLDIGAGECLHGRQVCNVSNPSLYVNLDLITGRLAPAAARNGSSVMRFVVGDGFALPFRDGVFDVVWGSGVLFRFRPLDLVAAEIARVLHARGAYFGIEPNFANPGVLLRYVAMQRGDRNDGRLRHATLCAAFVRAGLRPELRFFWVRIPWLRHRILSPTLGVIGRKAGDSQ